MASFSTTLRCRVTLNCAYSSSTIKGTGITPPPLSINRPVVCFDFFFYLLMATGLLPSGLVRSFSSSSSSSSLDLHLLPSPLGIVIPIGLVVVPLSRQLVWGHLSVSSSPRCFSSSFLVFLFIHRSYFFLRSLTPS